MEEDSLTISAFFAVSSWASEDLGSNRRHLRLGPGVHVGSGGNCRRMQPGELHRLAARIDLQVDGV